jgi:nitrogenase delta subunit
MPPAFKPTNMAERKYQKIYSADPLADVDAAIKKKIAPLEDYIMKNCLWQFNSRGWDRRKQNAGIIGKTTQLLCNEPVDVSSPQEKCYWVDAKLLDRNFRELFPWIESLPKEEILSLMKTLNARLDWLTIDGSLNIELTVVNY